MKTENKPAPTEPKKLYVHVKTGTPEEVTRESKTPKKGWHIAFEGSQEECAKYVTR